MNDDKTTETITIRVPKMMKNELKEVFKARGFTSISEFVRTAIRDALRTETRLTEEAQMRVERSRTQFKTGDSKSLSEVAEKADFDFEDVRQESHSPRQGREDDTRSRPGAYRQPPSKDRMIAFTTKSDSNQKADSDIND